MKKSKILLFNPRSADAKHRIPNSILQVGGALQEDYEVIFVDGNLEINPQKTIINYFENSEVEFFGVTVMPGPQLKQAIPITKLIKEKYPEITIIWGGYFASNQHEVVLNSGYVDFVISGPADDILVPLLKSIESGNSDFTSISNLIYKEGTKSIKTKKEAIPNMEAIKPFPYQHLDSFYPIKNYLAKTFMGDKTLSYHSSFGCPFTCSFCAVVPIYNAKWKGLSAERMANDLLWFKEKYDIDAVEFHDNNFFTARKRVVEFAEKIEHLDISWWGEGRIDTINKYSDEDLLLMKRAGLKMIFLGAETGNDEVLKAMDKGGTQTGKQIKEFAQRLGKIGIIPEYSFVLGMPNDDPKKVMKQINEDILFIKEIKRLNPSTEIIIYLYSPVPTDGSELFEEIKRQGFHFPEKMEDWLLPVWENFDLRKNPLTPWLNAKHVNRIKNFETVLNAYYPTSSDFKMTPWKRSILKMFSFWRYKSGVYSLPYELKLLQKIWRYRQPEEQGFYSE
mgnify:CR=1 FL=1